MKVPPLVIAWFVSPHGFGHAARAGAIMEAISDLDASVRFEVFTTIPAWFFQETLGGSFGYHDLETDIGFVQKTPFEADLKETRRALERFLPFPDDGLQVLARQVRDLSCRSVVCDISALGLRVAQKASLPSVLVENFTWDWIYRNYDDPSPILGTCAGYLNTCYQSVDHHIQTEPICHRQPAALTVGPVSRKNRNHRSETRRQLGIEAGQKLVLVTTGGVPKDRPPMDALKQFQNIRFVIPGLAESLREDNVLCLNSTSSFFHPDLVAAADAVIGKAGYSTIAEVFHSGVPFGYVSRPEFPESRALIAFIDTEMAGIPIDQRTFHSGAWGAELERLLHMPRRQPNVPNGAMQIAEYILKLLHR